MMVEAPVLVEKIVSFLQFFWAWLWRGSLKRILFSLFFFQSSIVFGFDWDNSFSESRDAFKKTFKFYKKLYPQAEYGSLPLDINNNLTFDYVYFPAKKQNKKIWVMSAGVHGIESFVGSAIINWLFKEKIEELVDDQTGVLLFHCINPFGYENKRRVNENNVDLNRNFILNFCYKNHC